MPFLGLLLAFGYPSMTPTFGGLNHRPDISRDERGQVTVAFRLTGIAGLVGLGSAVETIARWGGPGCLAAPGLLLNGAPVPPWLLEVGEAVVDRLGFK